MIAVIFIVITVLTGKSFADDIKFNATLERNIIRLGQSVQLNLQFEGSSKVSAPELPEISGIQSHYLGPSTRMSIINGRMSSSVTHIYRLVPTKTGKFTIGPLTVEHKGKKYTSVALSLEVVDSIHKGSTHSKEESKPSVDLGDRVFVEMEINKGRLYVNEPALLHIRLFINRMSVRDVRYPEYSHEGFSAGQFEKPLEYEENREGIIYSVLDFNTEIFPTKAGMLKLGSASIQANLVTQKRGRRMPSRFEDFFGRDPFDDLFGGYETTPLNIKSDGLTVNVLPLPEKDRPADFMGAIGNFQLDVSVTPDEVNAGDPVTLEMTVTGKGNFDTVHSPSLINSEGFKLYDPQGRQEANRKVFEQVLIPVNENIKSLPGISFSYFDTKTGKYRTIVKDNIPLNVMKAARSEQITILDPAGMAGRPLKKETIGRDIIYIKESPGKIVTKGGYLYKSPLFLLAQAVPLVLFAVLRGYRRRQERLSTDLGYARRLSAPKKAKKGILQAEGHLQRDNAPEFYDAVFSTLRDYLGNRFHLPSGGITADSLDDLMKGRNVDTVIIDRLKKIFMECDMVRYAPTEFNTSRMQETLQEMKESIDLLERQKG